MAKIKQTNDAGEEIEVEVFTPEEVDAKLKEQEEAFNAKIAEKDTHLSNLSKEKEELEVQKGLLKLKQLGLKASKDLKAQDPVTLEAIRQNQLKQRKLGLSAPSISLIASAGKGNIANNTTMNGGNITVNVAGSVIS